MKTKQEDLPYISLGKEVEHEPIAGLAWVQDFTRTGAFEVLEACMLQALIRCLRNALARALT